MKVSAILLAAGNSAQMGRYNPLMRIAGKTLIAHCATLLDQAKLHDIVMVTGFQHEEVAGEARRFGLKCTYNPDYTQGLFTSIRKGANSLDKTAGFFILPISVPLVRPATIAALATAFDGKTIILPRFNDTTGFPVLFPAPLRKTLVDYDGSDGLRGFLKTRKSKEIREVTVWDRGVLLDTDISENFMVFEGHLARRAIGERSEALALAGLLMGEKGVAHGLTVAGVAETLGVELNRHGGSLDIDLLYNSGLLHDIAKGRTRHESAGASLLRELGLHPLAEIVAGHRDAPPPTTGIFSEKEVVCLADKLVRGTYRVGIRQRFQEKLELYHGKKASCRAIRVRMNNALTLQEMVERTTGLEIAVLLGGRQKN